ncbi:hypothetical protein KM043_011242 [Ampulex compressa]|nr:hypothetical protein KM043_011242 [Ampulex compressa]
MKEEEFNNVGELQAVIGALLDMLDDKEEAVKKSVNESIANICKQNPEVVIRTGIYFWELHKKISSEHMASFLIVMCKACKHEAANLDPDLATCTVELAVNELMGDNESEAAELLIALSRAHCTQAMGGLLTKLEPGILPYPSIVRTIGLISVANVMGMLPFFKISLTIMLPMLIQTREDVLKLAFCFTIGGFCEAINDYIMNAELGTSPEITKETYKEEICTSFDVLAYNWLKVSRDNKVADAVLTALVPMIPLLPSELNNECILKLIPVLLNFCKRSNTRLGAVSVLATLLNHISENDKETLRPFLDPIHQVSSELISISPFEVSRIVLLTHYQVLQCCKSLVLLYPEEGLDRTLQQLKSPLSTQRARSLVVLRHLINTLPPENDGTLQRIALSLQDSLGDNSMRQMAGAIVALAARPSLPLLPSQRALFVRYMVSNCGTKNDESGTYSEALHLLATTVDGAESWLWPCLMRALLDPTCKASVVSVSRALAPLATKIIRNESISSLSRDFPGPKILSRCLELLGEVQNRFAIVTFLKSAAPLFGHQLNPYWNEKLEELTQLVQNEHICDAKQEDIDWEENVVEFLEESVKLEGEMWGAKLADELAVKASSPNVVPLLASICINNAHITLLIELARSNSTHNEFARAVGICSKRHLNIVLKLLEELCTVEDTRKVSMRLLGLVKDTKAAATVEASKSGLLKSYAEVANKGDSKMLYPIIEKQILLWILRQLNECKELTTKKAGLIALEEIAKAVHPERLPESTGLRSKPNALATLLSILQSPLGYRPLQLYPTILKAAVALVRIPPILNPEDREVFLSSVLDKVIGASSEIILLVQPDIMQEVIDQLEIICSEVVSNSADALAELVEILLPWMQANSNAERKTAIQVLKTTLTSYYNSIKYTFPSGKLDPGKLIGRCMSWCADSDLSLRHLIVDCTSLSLSIAARHHSIPLDSYFENDIENSKIIGNGRTKAFYDGMKNLAIAVSKRLPHGDIINFAEGLIEGLLFRGEAGLAAGIALSQHFSIRGTEINKADLYLVDNIIAQMRHMQNIVCRRSVACAIEELMMHHPEEVMDRLLSQPLPLDHASEDCWKAVAATNNSGRIILEILLKKLENDNLFSENISMSHNGKNNTAFYPSLAAIVALKLLLETSDSGPLIEYQLAALLSVLLKYFGGWLHTDTPASVINTKFGYVPNRDACKINPHREVYSVLTNVLITVDSNVASSLPNENVFSSDVQAEENVVLVVRTLMKCISKKQDVLLHMDESLKKLVTSIIPLQRAVATACYAELIGYDINDILWLHAIINTLHKAKADSYSLVRKLAIIGLARIAYIKAPLQVYEYFDDSMDALLDGLEEPSSNDGGNEVILESLRGLAILTSVEREQPVSPHVVLALKPFLEKEYWETRLAAITALGSVAHKWEQSVTFPNDDITHHLLGCLPSLVIRLEDLNVTIAKAARKTLWKCANLLQCAKLGILIRTRINQEVEFHFESFLCDFIQCLIKELPQRADELRNAVVRGYSKSENPDIRATSALILGLFGSPRPEDVQRCAIINNQQLYDQGYKGTVAHHENGIYVSREYATNNFHSGSGFFGQSAVDFQLLFASSFLQKLVFVHFRNGLEVLDLLLMLSSQILYPFVD